jgi:hypothetical protein
MIYKATERKGKAVVMAHGSVVTVQIADCGDVSGEATRNAQVIADALTVLGSETLWSIWRVGSHRPEVQDIPTVWIETENRPSPFEGSTLEQAIAAAAKRIRGEG